MMHLVNVCLLIGSFLFYYDLMTAVMICLGDSHGDNYSGILKLLDVLLSSERKPEEKKKILENDFSIEMTKSLEREVSIMCNLSKGVEEKGITKGIAQGITQGITQGILSSIQNLMESMSWSAEQAMNALKIPEEERSKYANAINNKK
jgi:predicted transposase YdaD